ncbi:MAG: hypothetical protein AB8C46_21605 [Burkholderiaceae bacterium]
MLFLHPTHRLVARLAALVLASVLGACSPLFDWRDVLPEQAPFAIALPGKPAEMSRNINLDGLPVKMQMVGARAGGLVFTAAWTNPSTGEQTKTNEGLAEDAPEVNANKANKANNALAAMQTGMVNNINGQITQQETRNIPLLGPQGNKAGLLPATFIDVTGQSQGKDMRMQAMFAAIGHELMQFVVVGESFSAEAANTFFESIRGRMRAGAANAEPS